MKDEGRRVREVLGFMIEQRVHVLVVNHTMEPTMNDKQAALDAYLARTAAIHAKLALLQQSGQDELPLYLEPLCL